MAAETLAIVADGPLSDGQWRLQKVKPRSIKDDELRVRIVASGICHADVHFGDIPAVDGEDNPMVWYPRVFGHEGKKRVKLSLFSEPLNNSNTGAGYVEQVGSAVKNAQPGDPVILSYHFCGNCYNCEDEHPAYCTELVSTNFFGEKGIYATEDDQSFTIGGSFFGQSSLASIAVVKERCVVNLRALRVTEDELRILAPLGCGIQTGCGAFTNIADVQPKHEVAVLGAGGVGQSAIMAAAMRKCRTIIAIDRVESRLDMARSLGATHTINTSDETIDLVAKVKEITGGRGVNVSVDTTGVHALAIQSWHFVRNFGRVLQIGLAKPNDMWDVSMANHMNSGKQIIGCVQGDAIAQKYVPEMIRWYREGKLPVDRLVTQYPVAEYARALEDMKNGATIKPVLQWPD